jgi:hypothetical protein
LDNRADLIANEQFSGEKTFCVVVGVDAEKAQHRVPGVVLTLIAEASSGYFDVDGKRLYSWKNNANPSAVQNYVKNGQRLRITIGVSPQVRVAVFSASSGNDGGVVTEVREVPCTAK